MQNKEDGWLVFFLCKKMKSDPSSGYLALFPSGRPLGSHDSFDL